MSPSELQAMNDVATKSAQDQRKQLQSMIDSNLDAADRITLRNSADAILNLTKVMALTPNPTA